MERKGLIKNAPDSPEAIEEVVGASRPVQRALARSAVYRLLSAATGYPTGERLAAMKGELLPLATAGADLLSAGLRRQFERFVSVLQETPEKDIQEQYHYCLGHVSMGDCPAYETAPIGSNIFQQSQVMADVAGFYRAFGFVLSDENPERIDHVTVELEFMRALAYKEAYARVYDGRGKVDICRQAERRFWKEHLGYWLPAFATRLGAKAESGVYFELALLLEKFTGVEDKFLGKPVRTIAELRPQEPLDHIPLLDLSGADHEDEEDWEMSGGDVKW